MDFNPQERIGLFIDGANLYAAARSLGFDIDYKRLREEFAGKARLIRALYYTALIEDQEYSPIPAAGRLARLQRLHLDHKADQRVHRFLGSPQGQRRHGYRNRGPT